MCARAGVTPDALEDCHCLWRHGILHQHTALCVSALSHQCLHNSICCANVSMTIGLLTSIYSIPRGFYLFA
jgi:hypothetical protein